MFSRRSSTTGSETIFFFFEPLRYCNRWMTKGFSWSKCVSQHSKSMPFSFLHHNADRFYPRMRWLLVHSLRLTSGKIMNLPIFKKLPFLRRLSNCFFPLKLCSMDPNRSLVVSSGQRLAFVGIQSFAR